MRYYCLLENLLIICCVEIKITFEKCDTSKILGVVTANLLTRSSPVELMLFANMKSLKNAFHSTTVF